MVPVACGRTESVSVTFRRQTMKRTWVPFAFETLDSFGYWSFGSTSMRGGHPSGSLLLSDTAVDTSVPTWAPPYSPTVLLMFNRSACNRGCDCDEHVDWRFSSASSSCRIRSLISWILVCRCSVFARMNLTGGMYEFEFELKTARHRTVSPCQIPKHLHYHKRL